MTVILAAITAFPQALAAVEALYTQVRSTFSAADQATLDAAFAAAKSTDATDTAKAVTDLQNG